MNVYVQVWVLVSTTSKSPWVSALDTKDVEQFGIKNDPKRGSQNMEYLERMSRTAV